MLDRRLLSIAFALSVAGAAAASAKAQEDVGSSVSAVVYGTDDRLDWYQIPSTTMQALGRDSIVAVMSKDAIDFVTPGLANPPFVDGIPTLTDAVGSYYGKALCSTERFGSQPTAASCSGTLVDDDIVITAGHCARTQAECESLAFVFDYYEVADGVLETIEPSDVYGCGRLLAQRETQSPHIDFAVIQLDRPVVGRVPVSVSPTQTAIGASTPLRLFGFGTGLPMKYDAGGWVVAPRVSTMDAFVTNTDTFAGNSGSGVFMTDGTLAGILVSGQEDYVVGTTCTAVNVLADTAAGEECTYAFRAVDALCAGGFPSVLCAQNPAPSCGDSFCSGGEDAANCAADCNAPHCADGICSANLGETSTTCPYDCTTTTTPPLRADKGRCAVSTVGATDARAALHAIPWLLAALFVVRRRR